ncbi:MAG TPA: sulfatase-like hydrolase/transferase [Gemmatimonadaceae bacterium]|nr:sulfatase-like hydrolase/transferase [Gemmatimonadaceae bacterium]
MLRPLTTSMLWLIALAAPNAAAQRTAQTAARPNIVLILMDDLGYGDLGSYGAPDARTPNIDRLAREGVKLTDFYSNGATCTPTRTGFITGRYQQRYGLEYPLGTFPADSTRGLSPSASSLPQLLKAAGYATGLVGKWHLGWKPEFHPHRHGFDRFWGFLGGYIDYYSNIGEFDRHDLFDGEMPTRDSAYLTDQITTHAVTFIEQHKGEPFFLEISYNATHWPFQRPNLESSRRGPPDGRDGTRTDYIAMLESADRGIGVILDAIDRLRLARNTLVIFTSDNGGEWLSRNAPLFHRKATLWEGGIRVPALFRWPARLPAGAVSKQVGITMDLTATLIAAAGATPPATHHLEGIDLIPLLQARRVVDRTLFWRIQSPMRSQRAIRRGKWKYMRDGTIELLFDLDTDPGERRDVTAVQSVMLPELRRMLAAWEADVDSSRAALDRR